MQALPCASGLTPHMHSAGRKRTPNPLHSYPSSGIFPPQIQVPINPSPLPHPEQSPVVEMWPSAWMVVRII